MLSYKERKTDYFKHNTYQCEGFLPLFSLFTQQTFYKWNHMN